MALDSALLGRADDLEVIRQCAADGLCCSVVGVSNLGKSTLLRHLCAPKDGRAAGTFVYVDCNQMPERTARAFFTATWHALATVLDAPARALDLYDAMVAAPSDMLVGLRFEEGIALALDHAPRPLVLCFDEFDESYQNLHPQAFLNLRALRDQHGAALVYVTATDRELAPLTTTREQGEFYELIVPRVHFLRFWEPSHTRAYCASFAAHEQVTFDETDIAFIQSQADGHPGLVQAVCYALGAVTGAPVRDTAQNRVIHQLVQQSLATDANVRAECEKIWNDLEPDEREALLGLRRAEAPNGAQSALRGLRDKFIVREGDDGPLMFSRLFDDFVRRQKFIHQPASRGVYMDVDAGGVWVDGQAVNGLTDMEYRLVLFLYGRLDRVCDKYAIVEAVWGQAYIDKVDDTRIEKLVSRVRQKIEPDPAHPRYLLSLRGRGYKLVR